MAYTVRDFFESRLPVPGNPANPVLHSPLYDYIVRRLFDSFDIPNGVAAYLAWQLPTRNQLLDAVHTSGRRYAPSRCGPVVPTGSDPGPLVLAG